MLLCVLCRRGVVWGREIGGRNFPLGLDECA